MPFLQLETTEKVVDGRMVIDSLFRTIPAFKLLRNGSIYGDQGTKSMRLLSVIIWFLLRKIRLHLVDLYIRAIWSWWIKKNVSEGLTMVRRIRRWNSC
ncbi:hypothetical protein SAMN04488101_11542 [Pedobacter nyackensis]|uniref:Uncharacterized protein n=1 Tax=Pedobacter nyackensis TaxID=475255 RepID=A0A1W2ET99_9SPHI|nr:hypothetical protein SAMN04488101_11542 [Pedobacter nyackensis]